MKKKIGIKNLLIIYLVFISSLSVSLGQVVLYSDWHFKGASKTILSNWNVTGASDTWNDVISSIRIPAGWEVTIYEHANFSGSLGVLTKDWSASGPSDPLNDRISSIRIRRITSKTVITGAEITFNTTSDDKDWDTKPYADILLNGQLIASLDCCSSDKTGDHWNNNSSVTKSLNINVSVSRNDLLRDGVCILGAQGGPHGRGNDTWKLNASLKIRYSDGTSSDHGGPGWAGIEFYSRSRSRESTNPIKLSK